MIKLNTPYHVAEENVTVTFTELKNGGIAGTYPNATLTGTLEGNVLSATFHNTAVNAVGLIELTFNENSFEGKWKNGLEPGPMRGKWSGECLSDSAKDSSGPATLTPDQLKWIETKDSWDYEEAPKEWLDSKDFILAAMKKDESILEYVSENLKDDKELILAAVSVNGGTLQYASDKCKDEKELVLAALSTDGSALEYASDRLKEDREVVLAAVSNYGGAIEYAPDTFKADKDIVSAAVLNEGCSLEYVTEEFKNDKSIVMLAVSNNGYSLQYASDKLKEDKEIVMAAIAKDGGPLNYASEKLRNDKEVVIASLANDAKALEYASGNLRRDKEVLEAAIKNDASLAYLLNENLSEEQKQCLEEGFSLEDFDEEYQGGDDGKVAWMKDRNFLSEAIKVDAHILKHASAELKADSELVIAAVKKDWTAISFADEKLQCHPEVLSTKVISYFKGAEKIKFEEEDLNVFINGEGFSDPAEHIENLLFKIEFLILKNRKEEFRAFCEKIISIVNSNHECFWILQAILKLLENITANLDNYTYFNDTTEVGVYYKEVSELINSFETNLDFSPEIEFETYFDDSEIDNNWGDCKWTSNEDEEGLPFTEFIMSKSDIQWDTESWSDVKFYNHAISRLWIGMQNYSLKQSRNGFDSDQVAVMFHEVIEEKFEAIQDSGNGHYGSYVFETVVEFLLGFPMNDYNLNESNREDLEDFNGWQYDLKKVGSACDCDLFDDWPGASEFAKNV
jgi:hypothetical protein